MDRLQFYLDNIVKGFDSLGVQVVWRDRSGNEVLTSIAGLLRSEKRMKNKIELLHGVFDIWKIGKIVKLAAKGDLVDLSKIDLDKINKVFQYLKSEMKRMLTDINDIGTYEIDMVKLDKFNGRIQLLKIM